jgi:hypothetical protein
MTANLFETLIDNTRKPDYHTIIWNGRDKNNTPVPSGVQKLAARLSSPNVFCCQTKV